MSDMPRPRRPYVQKEVTRHGKTVWYFRRGKEARIRLPGTFGSKEFNAAYDAAVSGTPLPEKTKAPQSSLKWLVDRFFESGRYAQFKPNTQRTYKYMLASVLKTGADLNFRAITQSDVKSGKVRREHKPTMAVAYVQVMRALFKFAVDSGWMTTNPADEISTELPKSDGHHTWTVDEVEKFQATHPIGTQARLAMDIMLYTGFRRSDAIVFGPQHIKNGVISLSTIKTGTDVDIPVLPPLAESIEATPRNNLLFLENKWGRPWQNISFGRWFADQCIKAGVPGRAHGLRKAGATIAADNGATPHELTAMYGWSSTKMAELYTKKADRKRLAERAANKLYPHQDKSAGDEAKNKA
jgi:integrase